MKIEDLLRINYKPETLEKCWGLIDPLVTIAVAQHELIADLKEKIQSQQQKFKTEIETLKEKVNTNSKNSSLPPSKDLQKKRLSDPQAVDLAVANSVTRAIRELYSQ